MENGISFSSGLAAKLLIHRYVDAPRSLYLPWGPPQVTQSSASEVGTLRVMPSKNGEAPGGEQGLNHCQMQRSNDVRSWGATAQPRPFAIHPYLYRNMSHRLGA